MENLSVNKDTKESTTEHSSISLHWSEEKQRLMFNSGKELIPVEIQPCFPWSHPLEHLSLKDKDGNEVALIGSTEELYGESLKAIFKALGETGFYFVVTEILAVEEQFELRHWEVMTSQGLRRFQTKLTHWPRSLKGNTYVIQDVSSDLYVIEDVEKLNKKSQKFFWPFKN